MLGEGGGLRGYSVEVDEDRIGVKIIDFFKELKSILGTVIN